VRGTGLGGVIFAMPLGLALSEKRETAVKPTVSLETDYQYGVTL
jgi:hypothetical protein